MPRLFAITAALPLTLLAACGPSTASADAIEAQAVNSADGVLDAADDRAEHLDEAGAALETRGAHVGGAKGAALEREGAADLAAAATAREGGKADADAIENAGGAEVDTAVDRR